MYPHITESFACTQKILAFVFLFPTNSLISSGTCSTSKLWNYKISILLQNKAIHCVPTFAYSSRFVAYAPSLIFFDKLFFEKTPLNLGLFL